jgi:hypothetical protein
MPGSSVPRLTHAIQRFPFGTHGLQEEACGERPTRNDRGHECEDDIQLFAVVLAIASPDVGHKFLASRERARRPVVERRAEPENSGERKQGRCEKATLIRRLALFIHQYKPDLNAYKKEDQRETRHPDDQ